MEDMDLPLQTCVKCDVCQDFFLMLEEDFESHYGYKGKVFCSDDCWAKLILKAELDTWKREFRSGRTAS